MDKNFPPLWPLLKKTVSCFMENNALRLSAALSYYSIFSLAPLLLIAVSITGGIMGQEAAHGELVSKLESTLGPQGAATVEDMIASSGKPATSIWMSIVGGATLLFGASGLFGQLKDALNVIWKAEPPTGNGVWLFLKDRFLSFAMVLGTGFMLLTSMILSTVLQAFSDAIGRITPFPGWGWQIIATLVTFALVGSLFAAIFKLLPDRPIRWKDVIVGAVVTTLLFHLGKFALGFYLAQESTTSPYGAAGSVILILLWVHYSSVILLFGAQFTRVFSVWEDTGEV